MKGLIIANLNLDQSGNVGVAKKLAAQRLSFEKHGFSMDLACLRSGGVYLGDTLITGFPATRFHRYYYSHLGFDRAIGRGIRNRPYDFLYIRYQFCNPALLWMLYQYRVHQTKGRVIIEIPTYPYAAEFRSILRWYTAQVDRITRWALRGVVDRIVTFSPYETIFGIPTMRIQNGVDLVESSSARPAPYDPSRPINLLGVASLAFWHGFDRVIRGMAMYRAQKGPEDPDLIFWVAGCGPEFQRLVELTTELRLASWVRFVGLKTGAELSLLYEDCHLAISSLGMHRHDCITSNLKAREYCAVGLPFLASAPDPGFPETWPYYLKVSADDSPVDLRRAVQYFRQLRQTHPAYADTMKKYAADNLTWERQLGCVVEYLTKARNSAGTGIREGDD